MNQKNIICDTCRFARKAKDGIVVACVKNAGDINLAALYGKCRRYEKGKMNAVDLCAKCANRYALNDGFVGDGCLIEDIRDKDVRTNPDGSIRMCRHFQLMENTRLPLFD